MAGNSAGARKGWATRRANARAAAIQAVEDARAVSRTPGVPPGAARTQVTRDGAIVWAAPRGVDGRIDPQAALGVGSVTDDIIGRRGAFVSRGGAHAGLRNVQDLRTVTVTFVLGERDESDEYTPKRITRRITVDFGAKRTTRDRELAIARAVQDHARALIRDDSSQQVYVTLIRVGSPIQVGESRRPSRKPMPKPARKAKPKAKPARARQSPAKGRKATGKGPGKRKAAPARQSPPKGRAAKSRAKSPRKGRRK